MSKSRIKKHKGVKLVDTRHPPPRDDEEEEKLLTCIMCNCMTIEEYLKRHIRYNHLISKEEIIDKLYNLHYPSKSNNISTQTPGSWSSGDIVRGESASQFSHKGKERVSSKSHQGRSSYSDDDEPGYSRRDSPQKGNRISPKNRKGRAVSDDEEEVLCPACGDVEDGSPMIACDLCDRWYHWACVGLMCKPQKGKEWICTECSSNRPSRKSYHHNRMSNVKNEPGAPSGSGIKSGGPSGSGIKANTPSGSGIKPKKYDHDEIKVTAVVKPRRDDDRAVEKVSERRSSTRGKTSPREDHSTSDRRMGKDKTRKRYSSSEHESPRRKLSMKEKNDGKYKKASDSEDGDTFANDLHYNDDPVFDRDFEPQESDYDEQDMRLGGKLTERRDSAQKRIKKKGRFKPEDSGYENMSRDELRELCHKEMLNATGNRDELEKRIKRHFKRKEEIEVVSKRDLKKYKLTEVVEGNDTCKICGLGWELTDELELGPLYKYGQCQAHLHCLMFSSGLIQGGEEKEGIVGFMPDDVMREVQRGSKLKCCFCKEIYATVGCCQRTCMRTYHLPCGIKYGALNEYYGNFDSYCPLHRSKRSPNMKKKSKNYVLTDLGLVPECVDMDAGFDSEKYKALLKKVETEVAERKKSEEKTDVKDDENMDKPEAIDYKDEDEGHARREEIFEENEIYDKSPIKVGKKQSVQRESSDEEDTPIQRKRPGPKSKTMMSKSMSKTPKSKEPIREIRETMSEPKPVIEEKRESKRVRKSTFGTDIYKSAKDELAKLLEKKHFININDTFGDLAGTRRRTARTTSVADEDEEDDEYKGPDSKTSRSRSRSGRKSAKKAVVEVDDEEDCGSKIPYTRKSTRNSPLKTEEKPEEPEPMESIESIEEFLTDTETKEEKDSEIENTDAKDQEGNSESGEEHSKEETPSNGDKTKTPTPPNLSENEFEDAERDNVQENIDQKDGFTDCADLSNVTSDEGTDLDIQKPGNGKTLFNEDEADDQIDLTNIINNLEEDDDEIKEIDFNKTIKRFKCPFCPHHSKEKRRVEQHITYAHKKGNFNKNMARGQKMMIFLDKKKLQRKEKSNDSDHSKDFETSSSVEEITKTLPFFKFSNDEMTDSIQDREEAERQNWSQYLQKLNKIVKQSPKTSDSSKSPLPEGESYRLSDSAGFVNKTEVLETKRERRKPNIGDEFVMTDDLNEKSPNPKEEKKDEKEKQDEKDKLEQKEEKENTIRRKRGLFQPQLMGTKEDTKKKTEKCNKAEQNAAAGDKKEEKTFVKRETRSKKADDQEEGGSTAKRKKSDSFSSSDGLSESMFECLKCGTKIKSTKELVTNHLKRHKLSLLEFKSNYLTELNSETKKKIDEWSKESTENQFKLLFSTVGDYTDDTVVKKEDESELKNGLNDKSPTEDEDVSDEKAVALTGNKVEKIVLRVKSPKSKN